MSGEEALRGSGRLEPLLIRSRRLTTWCEFSARLYMRRPCSWGLGTQAENGRTRRTPAGRSRAPPEHSPASAGAYASACGLQLCPGATDEHVQGLALAVD